jgi:myo-inositol-1(or 4)-monophosphatase
MLSYSSQESRLRVMRSVIARVRESRPIDRTPQEKPDGTWVTESDLAIERIGANEIKSVFPNETIVGEESGYITMSAPPVGRDSGTWWAIDPIDGTINWVRGLPLTAMSIGCCDGRDPVAGVVWDLDREEIWATDDLPGGARRISQQREASDLVVAVEYQGSPETTLLGSAVSGLLMRDVAAVRTLGCLALSLAWASRGHFDAVFHPRPKIWDYAGGAALIIAAGGVVRAPAIGEVSPYFLAGSPFGVEYVDAFIQRVLRGEQ